MENKFGRIYVQNIVRGSHSELKDIIDTCNGFMCFNKTSDIRPAWKMQDNVMVAVDTVQAFVIFDSYENASNAVKMFNEKSFMDIALSVQISCKQELLREEQELLDEKYPDRKFPWHNAKVVTKPIIPCVPTVAILEADKFPPINTTVIGMPPGVPTQHSSYSRRDDHPASRTARDLKGQHEAIHKAKVAPPRRYKSSLYGVVLDEDSDDDEWHNRAASHAKRGAPSRVVQTADKQKSGPYISLKELDDLRDPYYRPAPEHYFKRNIRVWKTGVTEADNPRRVAPY